MVPGEFRAGHCWSIHYPLSFSSSCFLRLTADSRFPLWTTFPNARLNWSKILSFLLWGPPTSSSLSSVLFVGWPHDAVALQIRPWIGLVPQFLRFSCCSPPVDPLFGCVTLLPRLLSFSVRLPWSSTDFPCLRYLISVFLPMTVSTVQLALPRGPLSPNPFATWTIDAKVLLLPYSISQICVCLW